jgi:hypothetical protein
MTKQIRPFANAFVYIGWEERNCCQCAKSVYVHGEDGDPCDIELELGIFPITNELSDGILERANLPDGLMCTEFEARDD